MGKKEKYKLNYTTNKKKYYAKQVIVVHHSYLMNI